MLLINFWLIIAVFFMLSTIMLMIIIYFKLPKPIKCEFFGKHVFITGGSKGIGKAIALEVLKRNCCCVTIVARDLALLKQTSAELSANCRNDQFVQYFQMDVSKNYKEIETVIRMAEKSAAVLMGKENAYIDILINNAGTVIQGGFDELEIEAFENQLRTNYLSLVYTTRAVIGKMKKRQKGHVAFVSSAAGQCSLWGYSAYSPSKFAVRGFVDALHMELLPFNVGVTILYPPNTNTEGFREELKTMTPEIRDISNAAGIFTPVEVASKLVDSMLKGSYAVSVGFEGWLLKELCAGAAPEPLFSSALFQVLLGGIFRGIMLIYLGHFNSIVNRCHKNKMQKKD